MASVEAASARSRAPVDDETLRLSAMLNAQKLSPIARRAGDTGLSFFSSLLSPLSPGLGLAPSPSIRTESRQPPQMIVADTLAGSLSFLTPNEKPSGARSRFSPKTPLLDGVQFHSSLTTCRIVLCVLRWLRGTATPFQALALHSQLRESETFFLLEDHEAMLNQRLMVLLDRDVKSRVFSAWRRVVWVAIHAENHYFKRLLRSALLHMDERLLFRKVLRKDKKLDMYHRLATLKRYFHRFAARTTSLSLRKRREERLLRARVKSKVRYALRKWHHIVEFGVKVKRVVANAPMHRALIRLSLRSLSFLPFHRLLSWSRSHGIRRQATRLAETAAARRASKRALELWALCLRRVRRERRCCSDLYEQRVWKQAFLRWRSGTVARHQLRLSLGTKLRRHAMGLWGQPNQKNHPLYEKIVDSDLVALRRGIRKLLFWRDNQRRVIRLDPRFTVSSDSSGLVSARHLLSRWRRRSRDSSHLRNLFATSLDLRTSTSLLRALSLIRRFATMRVNGLERLRIAHGLERFKVRRKALLCLLFWRVLFVRLRREACNIFKLREMAVRTIWVEWKAALTRLKLHRRLERRCILLWRHRLRVAVIGRAVRLSFIGRLKVGFRALTDAVRKCNLAAKLTEARAQLRLQRTALMEWLQLCCLDRRHRSILLARALQRIRAFAQFSRTIHAFHLKFAMMRFVNKILEKQKVKSTQAPLSEIAFYSTGLRKTLKQMLFFTYMRRITRNRSISFGPVAQLESSGLQHEDAMGGRKKQHLLAPIENELKHRMEIEQEKCEKYMMLKNQTTLLRCLRLLRNRSSASVRFLSMIRKFRCNRGLARWLDHKMRKMREIGSGSAVRNYLLRKCFKGLIKRASHRSMLFRLHDRAETHVKHRRIGALVAWHTKFMSKKRKNKACDQARLRSEFKRFELQLRGRRETADAIKKKLKLFVLRQWRKHILNGRAQKLAKSVFRVASLKQVARRQLRRWFRIARARSIVVSRKIAAEGFHRHRKLYLALHYLQACI